MNIRARKRVRKATLCRKNVCWPLAQMFTQLGGKQLSRASTKAAALKDPAHKSGV